MQVSTMKDLYIFELQDMYSGCNKIYNTTQEMIDKASDSALKEGLKVALDGMHTTLRVLESIIESHGEEPDGKICKGVNALAEEAKEQALEIEYGDDAVRDLMIISKYQSMTHYGISGFGNFFSHARALGLKEDLGKLAIQLVAMQGNDRLMTGLTNKLAGNVDA